MSDNIISIDAIRLERGKARKCVCEVRKFSVDPTNREITCSCGIIVDPFEAMVYLATHYEQINHAQKALYEQAQQWKKEKPHSVMFKKLEQNYRQGEMLPSCPNCKELFDFKQLTGWHNAQFYRKLQEKQKGAGGPKITE